MIEVFQNTAVSSLFSVRKISEYEGNKTAAGGDSLSRCRFHTEVCRTAVMERGLLFASAGCLHTKKTKVS
jgi:hypothetical protein